MEIEDFKSNFIKLQIAKNKKFIKMDADFKAIVHNLYEEMDLVGMESDSEEELNFE